MNWQIIIGALFIISGITHIFEDFDVALFSIALGAGLLYWGLRKKGYIARKETQSDQFSERALKEETFNAVGISYYEDNIRKLACNNPDWKLSAAQVINSGKAGKKIFKYYYVNKPVNLQEEPENPHDKNAIAVIIAGELVGYISREDNLHIKDILNNHEIKSLSSFIAGGEFKVVNEDGDISKNEFGFSVNIRIKYI